MPAPDSSPPPQPPLNWPIVILVWLLGVCSWSAYLVAFAYWFFRQPPRTPPPGM